MTELLKTYSATSQANVGPTDPGIDPLGTVVTSPSSSMSGRTFTVEPTLNAFNKAAKSSVATLLESQPKIIFKPWEQPSNIRRAFLVVGFFLLIASLSDLRTARCSLRCLSIRRDYIISAILKAVVSLVLFREGTKLDDPASALQKNER